MTPAEIRHRAQEFAKALRGAGAPTPTPSPGAPAASEAGYEKINEALNQQQQYLEKIKTDQQEKNRLSEYQLEAIRDIRETEGDVVANLNKQAALARERIQALQDLIGRASNLEEINRAITEQAEQQAEAQELLADS